MAPRKTQTESRTETTPKDQPSVTPREVGYGHDFVLSAIMENQRTLGELKQSISNIDATIKEQGKDIKSHSKIITFSSGAVTVALIVGGFFLNKLWDKVSGLITLNIPQ